MASNRHKTKHKVLSLSIGQRMATSLGCWTVSTYLQ